MFSTLTNSIKYNIKASPKTSLWGIALVLSEVIRNTPALLDFLPDDIGKYIFGVSSIICAVATVLSARDKDTAAQIEAKEEKKAVEREELKEEIKEEAKVLAADLVVKTAEETKEVIKSEILEILPAHIEAVVIPKAIVVPEQELKIEEKTVEIPKI